MNHLRGLESKLRDNDHVPKPKYSKPRQRWHKLCEKYPFLWRLCSPNLSECPPPGPMPSADFRALIGALRDPQQARILAELILEVIGPELLKVLAAKKAVKRK